MAIVKATEEYTGPTPTLLKSPTPVKVKNPAAVALGKLGGSKGGKRRAENLSPVARSKIAQQAAMARWAKVKAT